MEPKQNVVPDETRTKFDFPLVLCLAPIPVFDDHRFAKRKLWKVDDYFLERTQHAVREKTLKDARRNYEEMYRE